MDPLVVAFERTYLSCPQNEKASQVENINTQHPYHQPNKQSQHLFQHIIIITIKDMTDRVPKFRLWANPATTTNKRASSDEVAPVLPAEIHFESSEELKEPTMPKFHLAWEQRPHTGSAERVVPHRSNHNPDPTVPKFHKWF
jgi:hypothetical protein